jgi:AcrR family transcriptional regulator
MEPAQARRPTKSERTREQILRAAEDRFAAAGFAETRLEDVARDAGLATSAILYHFRDKRALYRAVLDQLYSGLLEELRRALAGPGTLPERIEGMVRTLVDYATARPAAAYVTLREAATTDPQRREEVRAQAAPFLELLGMVFEEGERAGAIRPIRSDPFHFVSAVAGAIVFYVAALPTFVAELPSEHLAPERVETLKRDVVGIARRLLGIPGLKAVGSESTSGRREDPS